MNLIRAPFIALIFALPFAAAAHAQNFDGPSVGVQAGWDEHKIENPKTDLGMLTIDHSKDSPDLGAFVGYDREFGHFVLGAEAGLDVGTNDEVDGGTAAAPITIDPRRSFDVTARAGYLVDARTLVYVRGGYTNERIRTTLAAAGGLTSASENRDGWLVGGGVERMILPRVSARLEYRYSDFSQGDGTYERHQILSGVTFHF